MAATIINTNVDGYRIELCHFLICSLLSDKTNKELDNSPALYMQKSPRSTNPIHLLDWLQANKIMLPKINGNTAPKIVQNDALKALVIYCFFLEVV